MSKRYGAVCAAACLAWAGTASAGELAVGAVGAGYDGAIRGAQRQSGAVPFVYYEGERFSMVFASARWRLLQRGDFGLAVTASGRFDGYEAGDSPYLAGMRTRDPALDVGLEASYGNLSLAVATDASNTHKGTEVTLEYSHGIDLGKLQLRIVPGVRWQDRKLTGYYFGVTTDEIAVLQIEGDELWIREAYESGQALVPKLGVLAIWRMSERWSLVGGAEVAHLPTEIADSPIVGKREQWGAFAGAAFHFR